MSGSRAILRYLAGLAILAAPAVAVGRPNAADAWIRDALASRWGIDASNLSIAANLDTDHCPGTSSSSNVVRLTPSSPWRNADLWVRQPDGPICRIRVELEGFVPVLVTRRDWAAGSVLRVEDLQQVEWRLADLRTIPLNSLAAATELRVPIRAGQPLPKDAVRPSQVVHAGQAIRVNATVGRARVEQVVTAKTDVGIGQVASFRTASGNSLRARLTTAVGAEVVP